MMETSVYVKKAGLWKIGVMSILFIMISGCAAKVARQTETAKRYVKLSLKAEDVIEMRFVRKNVETGAREALSLLPGRAVIRRFGGRLFEPKSVVLDEGEFLRLAQDALSLVWVADPVRARNPMLAEELIIKTDKDEERVEFEEDVSGELKDVYVRIMAIRQEVLKAD